MSEGILTIELDSYGFLFDTQWCYVALSWQLLAITALVVIGYKIYKRRKGK